MVETIRLESGHTLTGIVGSNPTLSAILFCRQNSAFSLLFFLKVLSMGRIRPLRSRAFLPIDHGNPRSQRWAVLFFGSAFKAS